MQRTNSPQISASVRCRLSAVQDGSGTNTCDYPFVFLEKATWAGLAEYAPPVALLMQRFFLEEKTILAIKNSMETERLGVVAAVCNWLRSEKNLKTWQSWLPPSRYWTQCELGEILNLNSSECLKCPPGYYSQEPYATECHACKPGDVRNRHRLSLSLFARRTDHNRVCVCCVDSHLQTVTVLLRLEQHALYPPGCCLWHSQDFSQRILVSSSASTVTF